jgi:lipopolysaccharide biosynthesis regulator YciM
VKMHILEEQEKVESAIARLTSVYRALSGVRKALEIANEYGQIDGEHHKTWVIDQMVRALTVDRESYAEFLRRHKFGDKNEPTYSWESGIAP